MRAKDAATGGSEVTLTDALGDTTVSHNEAASRSYLEGAPQKRRVGLDPAKRTATSARVNARFAERAAAKPDADHAAKFEQLVAKSAERGLSAREIAANTSVPRERVESILATLEASGRLTQRRSYSTRLGDSTVRWYHPDSAPEQQPDPRDAAIQTAASLRREGLTIREIAARLGYKSPRGAQVLLREAEKRKLSRSDLIGRIRQRVRYAIERDNPLLDEAFGDEPAPVAAKPASSDDLFDSFDPSATLPARAVPAAPPKKKRGEPTTITKQHLLSTRIQEPLRGTRLAYHLLTLVREFGAQHEIGRTAAGLLKGRIGGENADHFANLGELLAGGEGKKPHRLAGAYNWGRVKESLALDSAVRSFVSQLQISGPAGEGKRFQLAAKHYGLAQVGGEGKPIDSWAAIFAQGNSEKKVAFWKLLRAHVQKTLGDRGLTAAVTPDRLDRSLRRLAYQEQDRELIGDRGGKPEVGFREGVDENGRRVPGTVAPYRVDNQSWKDYFDMLPGVVAGSGTSSAERYARTGENPGEAPPPPPRDPAVASYLRRVNRDKRSRFAERVAAADPASLLPKVKRLLATHGTLPTRTLITRANMPAAKLSEVLDYGESIGELRRERRQSEGGTGGEGVFVSLAEQSVKMQRIADEMIRYARFPHEDLTALLNGVVDHGPEHHLPSLVFADWLEENGKPHHAAAIRQSIETGPHNHGRMKHGQASSSRGYFGLDKYASGRSPDREGVWSRALNFWSQEHNDNNTTIIRFGIPTSNQKNPERLLVDYPIRNLTREQLEAIYEEEIAERPDSTHYAAYKAPAGGVTVQGIYYPGGQLVPDLQRVASSTPPYQPPPPPRAPRDEKSKPKPTQPKNEPPPSPKSLRERLVAAAKRRAANR